LAKYRAGESARALENSLLRSQSARFKKIGGTTHEISIARLHSRRFAIPFE